MKGSILPFRVVLIAVWLLVLAVTIVAAQRMGLLAYPRIFVADFAHPWRAQFNTDLSVHLVLFAGWTIYRSRSAASGLASALAVIFAGALFTLPYLLAASVRSGGDMRRLLLGHRA